MEKEISLVGYGINYCEQRSVRVDPCLIRADKIFAVEPDITHIQEYMPADKPIINLFHLYKNGKKRSEVYNEICDQIFLSFETDAKVALLVEGCPFFLDSICEIIEDRSFKLGIKLNVIDGISSLDTIIHQLGIPISNGSISAYVANDFCSKRPILDKESILMLFQPGNVNSDRIAFKHVSEHSVNALKSTLLEYYSPEDRWILVNLGNSPSNPTQVIWNHVENIDGFINYLHSGTLIVSKKWWPIELEGALPTVIEEMDK